MPIYEYYCADCNGVFELLRPARQATLDQPCPECDADGKRIMSRDFATFTYRDGYPRRIPDDGSYYHMGQKVSKAISYSPDGYSHPELHKPEPERAPSIEDIEQFELLQEMKQKGDKPRLLQDVARKEDDVKKQMVRAKGTRVQERAKQSALKAARETKKKAPKD